MSRAALPPFAHWLPYWAVRATRLDDAPVAVLVLVDGTLAVGFRSTGADVFSAENSTLNRNAAALRRALNVLPPGAFLQTEWHTGASHEDVIGSYEARGQEARRPTNALLIEQRRARAEMLRADSSLRRGELLVVVGQTRALGALSSHAAPHTQGSRSGGLFGFLGLGSSKRHPQEIDARTFQSAVDSVLQIASRVRDELSSTGSVLLPLDEGALLSHLHRALNPQTSRRMPVVVREQSLDVPAESLKQPEVTVVRPLSLREQLPLGDLTWSEEGFTLDDPAVPSRVLTLQRMPAFTRPDLMMGLQFASGAQVRLVSTFIATDKQKLTEQLIRKRNVAHASAMGIVRDVSADVAFSEYERVLEKMLTEDQRVFRASVTVVVHSDSDAGVDSASRELKEAFSDAGAVLTTESGRQLPAFLGSLPGNGALAPRQLQLITNSAADFIPYFVPSEGDSEAQLLYHTRQGTLRKLSFLPSKRRANNNALVFGSSGSGKSFNVACIFEQAFLSEGCPLLVVDVQGPELSSYKVLAELFGGTYTALAYDEEAAFSPFVSHADLFSAGQTLDEDALSFMNALVCVMALPDFDVRREKAFAKEIARRAILGAYQATARAGRAPLLSDVVGQLSVQSAEHPEHAAVQREMYLQLRAWIADPVRARLLNRSRKEDRRAHSHAARPLMQVFDFFSMEKDKELATVLLLSVSFSIWQELKRHSRDTQKLVVFDECWKLLSNQTASDLVAELFRTGRKWGASTWAITQSLSDFMSSPVHGAVLNNAAMVFLMQHAGDHDAVARLCGLNEREAALFRQLRMKKGEYSEMLFVERSAVSSSASSGASLGASSAASSGGGESARASILRLVPTACDLWLNTTDPTDVGFRNRNMKDRGTGLLDTVRFLQRRYPRGAPRPGDASARRDGET